ncbi:MAG: type II toxin-antitoxin system prevent-host-death family antitoxin [Solirubrobacteraceae bacterium]
MGDAVSVRELRNSVSAVLRRVESGERVTVTVDRRPVAEIVPLRRRRVVPASEAREVAARYGADAGLGRELRSVFGDTTDEL